MNEPEFYQFGISSAGNTHNPCLIILREKGYELWLEWREIGSLFCARKDGLKFKGTSGSELLGIVSLWEHFGNDWDRQAPNVRDELPII
ncbi:hypothetical protein MalM14_59820 [Gimesia chilikensis]|nr:hypothetical protein MalM14_59820 [Gimesia chilikensis]